MRAVVVSDVHLGSRYCNGRRFATFLAAIPDGAELVLNGDTLDHPLRPLPADHARILAAVREQSRRRRVVWVRGNNDERTRLDDPAGIEFREDYRLAGRLYAAHGHRFETLMLRARPFLAGVRLAHRLGAAMGLPSRHIAEYAKRWHRLYALLRRQVAGNAVRFARENGFGVAACGHTHYPEDLTLQGVRYVNTGAWTEESTFCLWVDGDRVQWLSVEHFQNGNTPR
jgi:UDP-2,3-diacylglucosamine pyrophosphatase LpxH